MLPRRGFADGILASVRVVFLVERMVFRSGQNSLNMNVAPSSQR